MQGNTSSDLIIWGVPDTSANTDDLNGGGHVINTAAKTNQRSPFTTKLHKSRHFNPTQIPVNNGIKSPPHSEYDEKESGETERTNTLSGRTEFPQVRYSLKRKAHP
jgi:hypothetical protein